MTDVEQRNGKPGRRETDVYRKEIHERLQVVNERLDTLDGRYADLQQTLQANAIKLDQNTELTQNISKGTAELIELMGMAKAGFRAMQALGNVVGFVARAVASVLGFVAVWVRKIAKFLGPIITFITGAGILWYQSKHGWAIPVDQILDLIK